MEVSALIPVRSGSRRIPNKNAQVVGEHSLLESCIVRLQHTDAVDRIIVGTDCSVLATIASEAGAEVVWRDDVCCDETVASANMMIADFVSKVDTDIVMWSHCTNPFVSSETYQNALATFVENLSTGYDSLLSVAEVKEHLWGPNEMPLNYNPYQERHPLVSELPVYYKQTGAFFIQLHETVKKNHYFFANRPFLFKTTELESVDINTPEDLELARAVATYLSKDKKDF